MNKKHLFYDARISGPTTVAAHLEAPDLNSMCVITVFIITTCTYTVENNPKPMGLIFSHHRENII